MHATPAIYIPLQNIYREKAAADRDAMWLLLTEQLAQRNVTMEASGIDRPQFDIFCKNSKLIQVHNMSSIHAEQEAPDTEDYGSHLYEGHDNWRWHLTVRAFEAARMTKPDIGVKVNDEADFAAIQAEVAKQNAIFGVDQNEDKYSKEILRFGNAKIHNISAFMGGLAAQEACKLLMSQYIPMVNTFIWDGIRGQGSAYKM